MSAVGAKGSGQSSVHRGMTADAASESHREVCALQAIDMDIGYHGRVVGRRLSLSVRRHEVVCLLGPNGSGKSTLFKTLLGLMSPLAGQALVGGRPVSAWSRRELARQAGYVPQAQEGGFAFTVLDVVLMGRTARMGHFAGPSAHDLEVATQCLAQMGIGSLAGRPYTEISGGERQLALIARAIAQEPVALVMDEPTAALDFGNQVRVLEHIRSLRQHGMGILLCTHQPDHALRVADRLLLLKNGELRPLESKEPDTLLDSLAWLYELDRKIVAASLPASMLKAGRQPA